MKRLKTPTIDELVKEYRRIAAIERMKCQRPSETTVVNIETGVRAVLSTLLANGGEQGYGEQEAAESGTEWIERAWNTIDRAELERYLSIAAESGVSPTTAWTYLQHLRALTARWTRPYYEAKGWKVDPVELPFRRKTPVRYVRPERDVLLKVKSWYESLEIKEDRREWLAATLMMEFAMRNGDVTRLRWSDFRCRENDTPVLCYTPRKTSLTSGRTIAWPVHPVIWEKMQSARAAIGAHEGTHFQGLVVPAAAEVFSRLNADLRSRHFFTGSKQCYELRKICIDHVYQHFGAERASAISGDDIRTVTRYYADPSKATSGAVIIADLL